MAAFSAMLTILCATAIAAWQVASWLRYGEWNAFPISFLINILQGDNNVTYVMQSSQKIYANRSVILDLILEIPATLALLSVAALLIVFYRWLTVTEKRNP
jgi:hypothetical protein